jgi:hypothetical protein
VLLSANAFSVREHHKERIRFRIPANGRLHGLDAALDSAGFVAMVKYGGFDWSVEQYGALAAAHDWAWWAQMDCCCEPEVAGSKVDRLFRIAETARLYGCCEREAERRSLKKPMPVLQGWYVDDYRRSANLLPVVEWPALVGIGSVCRRAVHGPDGIVAIVEALDKELPEHVKLHLFGVKGTSLGVLAGHRRVESVDSMAWDMAARRKWPTGRTMEKRIGEMHLWRNSQIERVMNAPGEYQESLDLFNDDIAGLDGNDAMEWWAELIASGEIDMQSAGFHWAREEPWVT